MFIDMGIDYLFYPEKVAASEVINLLGHTSTTEFVDFSSGKLSLVVFHLEPTSWASRWRGSMTTRPR